MDSLDLNALESTLGYSFQDEIYLVRALTHPGMARRPEESYQRYEFLGDRVLGLAIAHILFQKYPRMSEGGLSRALAHFVCREALAVIAERIGLPDYIILTQGERRGGAAHNASVLADSMEAVLAAVYMDGGMDTAQQVVLALWTEKFLEWSKAIFDGDSKSRLQEWAQSSGKGIPVYAVCSSNGPDHAPQFVMEVQVPGMTPVQAQGTSKKDASQRAAQGMLNAVEQ